jgi:hypothetical protein
MWRASKLRAIQQVGFASLNKPDVLSKITC